MTKGYGRGDENICACSVGDFDEHGACIKCRLPVPLSERDRRAFKVYGRTGGPVARAEMIRTLAFCEPCGALLGIYRHRGSFAGVVHALLLIKDCPSCGPQLRDEQPQYSVEEFATYVVAQKGSSRS